MSDERWVVLGAAGPSAEWFRRIAGDAHRAVLPIEFVKCLSIAELRSRLVGGRPYSAVLVGDDATGLDRDLIAECERRGLPVVVIAALGVERDWHRLGARSVLPAAFARAELMLELESHGSPVSVVTQRPFPEPRPAAHHRGRLITVVSTGNAGGSVLAMALAQQLGGAPSNAAMVLLADAALDADLAMLHDIGEVTPSMIELVDNHARSTLDGDAVRAHTFDLGARGYHLLPGLRRHRDWTAIRPKAFAAALEGMRNTYRFVVADTDGDTEGRRETGSTDIDERNHMARTLIEHADVCIAVGLPGTKGAYALHRLLRRLAGVSGGALLPVVNLAPRRPWRRAATASELAELWRSPSKPTEPIGNPVFEAPHRDLERALRAARPLPGGLGRSLHTEVQRRLADLPSVPAPPTGDEPELVVPGSLGHWDEQSA